MNEKGNDGSPLHCAVIAENRSAVNLFLSLGAYGEREREREREREPIWG